jgi:Cu/Ag efflux pump CusA
VEGFPQPIGDAVINDGPGILLIVEKQPTGNTLDVTRNVEAALDSLRPGLQNVEVDSTIFRPATFIEMSLANLNRALLIGALLVIVILIAFLFEWRTALISLTALPLSLISAALIIRYSGQTINTMVLAGLAIALGEVVDDAIIDVENIVRRLRLNRASPNPEPVFQVVLNASVEVRSAVVYASVIVGLVFLPVFFLEGLAGSFFRPLAMSYVLAVLASLVVALTVTPALSLLLLPGSPLKHRDPPLVRGLKRLYRPWVNCPYFRPRSRRPSGAGSDCGERDTGCGGHYQSTDRTTGHGPTGRIARPAGHCRALRAHVRRNSPGGQHVFARHKGRRGIRP